MAADDPASPVRHHLQRAGDALYLAQLALTRARELIGQDAELGGQLAADIAEVRRRARLAAEMAGRVGEWEPAKLTVPTRLAGAEATLRGRSPTPGGRARSPSSGGCPCAAVS